MSRSIQSKVPPRSPRVRRIFFIAAICAIQGVLLWYYLKESSQTIADAPVDPEKKAAAEKERITAGVPVQRQRIDDFIDRTAAKDFDDLSASLHETGEDYNLVFDGGQTSGIDPPSIILQLLADRRIAKMYAILADQSPEVANRVALMLFDEKLAIYDEGTSNLFAVIRGQMSREQALEQGPFVQRTNAHALSASLLLCTRFCDPGDVLQAIDAATARVQGWIEQAESEPPSSVIYVWTWEPSPLLILNLYLDLLNQHGCLSAKKIADALALSEERVQLSRHPLSSWDAHTNATDFTHVHRGVPVDGDRIVREYTILRTWSQLGIHWERTEEQQKVLDKIRVLVDECVDE